MQSGWLRGFRPSPSPRPHKECIFRQNCAGQQSLWTTRRHDSRVSARGSDEDRKATIGGSRASRPAPAASHYFAMAPRCGCEVKAGKGVAAISLAISQLGCAIAGRRGGAERVGAHWATPHFPAPSSGSAGGVGRPWIRGIIRDLSLKPLPPSYPLLHIRLRLVSPPTFLLSPAPLPSLPRPPQLSTPRPYQPLVPCPYPP